MSTACGRFFLNTSAFFIGTTLIVVALWGLYGLFNGFSGETALIYTSDINPGFGGFLYADPLRKFTSLFYHLSYVLGSAAGERGSFVPYQLVYAALWISRAVLTYLVVDRLMPHQPALAIFSGLFSALYAADGALNWVGQLNQHGFVFLMLLSFYLLLLAFDARSIISATGLAAASAFAGYLCLWSYESPLPVMFSFPVVAALLRRDTPFRRQSYLSFIYLIPVAVFVGENIERYFMSTAGSAAYQVGVSRHDFALNALSSDLWLHVKNSFTFWKWPHAHFTQGRLYYYVKAGLLVFVSIVLVVQTAVSAETKVRRPFRIDARLLAFGYLSGGLLIASYLVILLLADNRNLWRTEFLPSFAAACMAGAAFYSIASLFHRTVVQTIAAICLFTVVGGYSTLAGVNSTIWFHAAWEKQRTTISSIVANAPDVAGNTLIIIRNVSRPNDPFGHNMWFDVALRLAYPGIKVAGIYFYDDGSPALGMNIDLKSTPPLLLPDGFPTLFHLEPKSPIRHFLVFNYNSSTGEAEPVLSRDAASGVKTTSDGYDFCAAVASSNPSVIAVRRYGPIAKHDSPCAQKVDR